MRLCAPFPAVSLALVAMLSVGGPTPVRAQQDWSQVEIETVPVSEGLHMLVGRGGNIAVSTGADGTLVVDDQFAPLQPKISAAIEALRPGAVRFLLNTHWHGDHTGGNEAFAGLGATIVAHDQVRVRMAQGQSIPALERSIPPAPAAALPVVTWAEGLTIHWNGETIELEHAPAAHTDGDAIVWFRKANAVHLGDLYFNGSYPFIDVWSGGSSAGVIAGVDRVLATIDDETRVIPGHGPLSSKSELARYRALLVEARARVAAAIAEGQSLEAILAAGPTAEWDAAWGGGFLTPERFVTILHADLSRAETP